MIYFIIGFMIGFLLCLAAVLVFVRMEVKKTIDDKKEQLHEQCITRGQIIGLNGYIPCGKAER